MSRFLCLSALAGASILMGCTSHDVSEASPTVRLFRGEIAPDQYADEVTRANEEVRDAAQFEVNRLPTRAYNTRTGRYEFVPEDTEQRWNDEAERWEFTPVGEDDREAEGGA